VGTLGEKTRLATAGPARAHLHVTWARLASLCRALLDEEAVRRAARLRRAPSLLRDGAQLTWLAPGPGAEARVLRPERDPALGALLDPPSAAEDAQLAARIRRAREQVAALPSHPRLDGARALDGVVALRPAAASLSREAVERAARLAPTLFRLQAAFAPTW